MNKNVLANVLAWFHNWRCNSQTSRIECNRYEQNQHCQFTGCTRNVLLYHGHMLDVFLITGQWSCQKSTVQDRTRHRWDAVSIHLHYGLSVVDTMLHDSPDLVIHRTEIWAVWRPQVIERKKVWRFLTQQFNCCTCAVRCAGAPSCWNKVVTRHSAYCWQQYDIIITPRSSVE